MNPADLGLEDIITPEAISLWPPAIGWWLLLILIIAATTALICFIKYYRRKWGYRKQALALLKTEFLQWQQDRDNSRVCQQIDKILKRTALTIYGDADNQRRLINTLHGKPWLDFLNKQAQQPIFVGQPGRAISEHKYQQQANVDVAELYQSAIAWIKLHAMKPQAIATIKPTDSAPIARPVGERN